MSQESVRESIRLVCRLRRIPANEPYEEESLPAELELHNTSSVKCEAVFTRPLIQHVQIVTTDQAGQLVGSRQCGTEFAPLGELMHWMLNPGQKIATTILLSILLPPEIQRPGRYSLKAVFQCEGIFAESDPVLVELS